jgi:hypothetical protein
MKRFAFLYLSISLCLAFTIACADSTEAQREPDPAYGASLIAKATCIEGADSTCPNSPMPTFALADFQPQSPWFEETYGLEQFKGKTTVVALLAAW